MMKKGEGRFSEIILCADRHNWIELPVKVPPETWFSKYIGRKVIADLFAEKHGVNGFYSERDDYNERGIYLNVRVKLDKDGYIKEVSSYKERLAACSPHGRPAPGRTLELTRADMSEFDNWLKELLVPTADPTAYRSQKTLQEYLPDGMSFEDFKKQYVKMVGCVRKGDVVGLKQYRTLVAYDAAGFPSLYEIVLKNNDSAMARALVSYGARVPDCCDLEGRRVSFEIACAYWPYIEECGCLSTVRFKCPLTYSQASKLISLSPKSKVHFPWTKDLYREFKAKNPRVLKAQLVMGNVDLSAEDYIDLNDVSAFVAKIKLDDRSGPEYFLRGTKWAKAVLSSGVPYLDCAYGMALSDLASKHDYKRFQELAALTTGTLPSEAFSSLGECLSSPPKDRLSMIEFLEGLVSRFDLGDDRFDNGFVKALLKYGSAKVVRKFLERYLDDLYLSGASVSVVSDLIVGRDDDVYRMCVEGYLKARHGEFDDPNEVWINEIIEYVSDDESCPRERVDSEVRWLRSLLAQQIA